MNESIWKQQKWMRLLFHLCGKHFSLVLPVFFFHHIFSLVPWIILAPKVERLHRMEVNIFYLLIYYYNFFSFLFFNRNGRKQVISHIFSTVDADWRIMVWKMFVWPHLDLYSIIPINGCAHLWLLSTTWGWVHSCSDQK